MFMSECISEIYFLIVRILNREYFFVCFFVLVFLLLLTNQDYKKKDFSRSRSNREKTNKQTN